MIRLLHWLAAAVWLAAALPALAQGSPRSYAVLSEVAREVNVVIFQEDTGTRLGNNLRQRIPIPDGALDKVALLAVRRALGTAAPGARVWLVTPLATDLFPALQNPSVGTSVALPADLADAMRQQGSTHLLLLSRHRDDAAFTVSNGSVGAGVIDGLGFYLDRHTEVQMRDSDQAALATGFLSAYAYFRLSLIDAASSRVVSTQAIKDYRLRPTSSAAGAVNPWDAMTTPQKIEALRTLLEDNVGKAVPQLLATP